MAVQGKARFGGQQEDFFLEGQIIFDVRPSLMWLLDRCASADLVFRSSVRNCHAYVGIGSSPEFAVHDIPKYHTSCDCSLDVCMIFRIVCRSRSFNSLHASTTACKRGSSGSVPPDVPPLSESVVFPCADADVSTPASGT